MKTRFSSAISFLMAAILVLGVVFTSCTGNKRGPEVGKHLNKILEATFSGEPIEAVNTRSDITINASEGLPIPYFQSANLTLYGGASGESILLGEATVDDAQFDFSLYNAGLTFIAGSSLLGDKNYGFEITDMGTLFQLIGSFAPGAEAPADNAFEAPGSANPVGGLINSMTGISSLLNGDTPKKVYSLLEKYAKIIADAAEGACNGSVQTGETVEVSVQFNTDSAKKLVKDVFAALKKDKALKDIITDVLVTSGIDKDEASAQISSILSDETARYVYDMLDAMPFSFTATFGADKDYVLNAFSVEIKSDGVSYKIYIDGSAENCIALGMINSVSIPDYGTFKTEEKITLETKTENGTEIFEINTLSISDGVPTAKRIFRSELKDENYVITVLATDPETNEPLDVILRGTNKTEGNKNTVTLTSVTAFGNTLAYDITIVTETGVTLPKFPTEYVKLLELTGDDFNDIIENLKNGPLGQFIPKDEGEVVLPEYEY